MSKSVFSMRKTSVAVLTATILVTSSAVAFAWWSSLGSGDGTAATANSAATLTVSVGSQVGALAPGGPAVTVPFTVKNPGDAPLRLVNDVVVTFADAQGTAWSAPVGCAPEAYHATGALTGGAAEVAAGATVAGVVTITMDNLASDQNACKGASLPLHISVS